jgi:hypothetical protein
VADRSVWDRQQDVNMLELVQDGKSWRFLSGME